MLVPIFPHHPQRTCLNIFLRSGSLWKVQNEQHWNTPSAFLVLFFFSIESRESNQVMAVHIHVHRYALAPTKEDGLQKLCIPLLVQVGILIFVLLVPILPAPAPSSLSSTFWCFYLSSSIQTGTWSSLSNNSADFCMRFCPYGPPATVKPLTTDNTH